MREKTRDDFLYILMVKDFGGDQWEFQDPKMELLYGVKNIDVREKHGKNTHRLVISLSLYIYIGTIRDTCEGKAWEKQNHRFS